MSDLQYLYPPWSNFSEMLLRSRHTTDHTHKPLLDNIETLSSHTQQRVTHTRSLAAEHWSVFNHRVIYSSSSSSAKSLNFVKRVCVTWCCSVQQFTPRQNSNPGAYYRRLSHGLICIICIFNHHLPVMLAGTQQANTHGRKCLRQHLNFWLSVKEHDWYVIGYIMPFLIETLDSLAVLIKLRRPKVVFFCQWITPLVPHFVQSRSSSPSREARKKEKLNEV